MQKVLTAAEMREVDRLTTERYGIPSIILMENAAHAVARVITEKLGGSVKGKNILILCGKGNNGGDGAALGRILANNGAEFVEIVMIGNPDLAKGDARINFDICSELSTGGNLAFGFVDEPWEFWQLLTLQVGEKFACIIDALFGTGLTKPMDESFYQILHFFEKRLYISVDIPSGLYVDNNLVSPFQHKASATVTFTAPKPANILPPASHFNGELIVANIGSPQELIDEQPSQLYLAEKEDASNWLQLSAFSDSSYKNKRGHTLLITGSDEFSGAAVLAGNAAMRSGVGLVTVATPHSAKDAVASRIEPEVMVRGIAETEDGAATEAAYDEISDLVEKADAIAIGCGLSQSESTKRFVEKLIENRHQPIVVDADALNLLSPFKSGNATVKERARRVDGSLVDTHVSALILTPHEGEFLRLLGKTEHHPDAEAPPGIDKAESFKKDRVAAVREFSQKHNVILVLKGERVLIGEPGGKVVVNPTGNSGLGKAGNGDTLTGILAGFVTQAAALDIDIFETVVAAVYIAGMAGDIAEKKYGKRVMTASDVRECLVDAFKELNFSNS